MPKSYKCVSCNFENELPMRKSPKVDSLEPQKPERKESKKCTLCNTSFETSRKEHNTTDTHKLNNELMKKVKLMIHDNKQNKLISFLDVGAELQGLPFRGNE